MRAEVDDGSRGVLLRLEGLAKAYGGGPRSVDEVSLEIRRGEIFTLLGPSGCGKTTTLRMIAGLEAPDEGRIVMNGRVLVDARVSLFVPPHKRNMGMVFQSYAVWPHMSVFENIAYPLRLRGVAKSELVDKVQQVLDSVGMRDLADRAAHQLSGGQQQRVALCRALVYGPDLLLLDEPFSNLDSKLREHMCVEVKQLQRKLGIGILLVTHDQNEALSLSDRIAVMDKGKLMQLGTPRELYDEPATPFVRDFLGKVVLLRGKLASIEPGGRESITLGSGISLKSMARAGARRPPMEPGQSAVAAIRPSDIIPFDSDSGSNGENLLQGRIHTLLFSGNHYEAQIILPGEESVLLQLPRSRVWTEGQRVDFAVPPDRVQIWPA